MRLAELFREVAGSEVLGGAGMEIGAVEHDSRRAGPGALFVCIRGLRQDGHAFIPEALSRGAVALVVEREPAGLSIPAGVGVVRVPDGRIALAAAAARLFDYPSRALQMVAVTGTNGKTTTAFLVERILSAAGRRTGLLGTIAYRCGEVEFPGERTTPESSDLQRLLRRMQELGARAAAMEVSSHALALHRTDGCEFDVAIFTNLTQDHLDFHGSLQAYAEAKAALFRGLGRGRTKSGEAAAVVNADDPGHRAMLRGCTARVVTFGLEAAAEIVPRGMALDLRGIRATVATPWGELEVASPLVGRHNLSNILAAAGACLHLGLTPVEVAEGIAALQAVPGRFEKVESGQPFGVFVDYAHTPDALERVLAFARSYAAGRVIAVFGCGGDRDRGKRPLMGAAAVRLADLAVLTSDNPRSEEPGTILAEIETGARAAAGPGRYRTIADRREAIAFAVAEARPGDLVVIAGKGHETYQILRERTIPFDDRRAAADALGALGYAAPGGAGPC
jgi:UDP-N-acetylmuramoyl-L-alanyl-D-glutamate--2,6-diaminopimelate ligase